MQKKRSLVLSQQVTVTTVCTCLFCSVIITGNLTDSFSLHHINNGDFNQPCVRNSQVLMSRAS